MTDETRRPEIDRIVETVAEWPGVTADDHRFGGIEFRLEPREVGHVHRWGIVDIAFPRRIRDRLVEEGKTGPHHIYPESGWTTFHLDVARAEKREDSTGGADSADAADTLTDGALWLLRLSYLLHAKAVAKTDAGKEALGSLDVEGELDELTPSDELRALL